MKVILFIMLWSFFPLSPQSVNISIYLFHFAPCGAQGPPVGGFMVVCIEVVSDQPTDCTSSIQSLCDC